MKYRRFLVFAAMIVSADVLSAQKITEIAYVTAEGNQVVLEKTWATAFVSQETEAKETPGVSKRSVEFKPAWAAGLNALSGEILLKDPKGAAVAKLAPDAPSGDLPAGVYTADVSVDFGVYGKVRFSVAGVEVKDASPANRPGKDGKQVRTSSHTRVSLQFNLPLVRIERTPENLKGEASYEAVTYWALDKKDGNYIGYAKLFPPGERDAKKMIRKNEGSDRWGKAPAGTYDFLVNTDISFAGRAYDVRILRMRLDANSRLKLHLVMNGALVTVTAPKAPHAVHFYQPGTAAKSPKPVRDQKSEVFTSEAPRQKIPCPPGTYDVLYNFDWGGRYEWRPGVRFNVGSSVALP